MSETRIAQLEQELVELDQKLVDFTAYPEIIAVAESEKAAALAELKTLGRSAHPSRPAVKGKKG